MQTSGTADCGRAEPRGFRDRDVEQVPSGAVAQDGGDYEPAHLMQDLDGHDDRSALFPSSVPISTWSHVVLRNILKSRTPFAHFVRRAIHHCKTGTDVPATSALFPIPLPHDDVWDSGLKNANSSGRRRLALRKMLHLVILGLNYVHFERPLSIVHLLGRRPNTLHYDVYLRVMAFIKAGGPPEEVSIFGCGRKSHQLDARFRELERALLNLNLFGKSSYGHTTKETQVVPDNQKDELRPYRELDASRLKLSGRGNWDPTPFLSDLFYMPYVEPRCNQFGVTPPDDLLPDLSHVSRDEILRLCKVWDNQDLLRIYPAQFGPKHKWGFSKIFNNFKNSTTDRQIGDRRGMNFAEGRIVGPSKTLPSCSTLLQLCPQRFTEMLAVAIADRRDFYHQFKVSDQRACSNAVFPVFCAKELVEFKAYDGLLHFVRDLSSSRERTSVGDFLHGKPGRILVSDEMPVVAAFGALYQGDHLGVEFATDSHAALIKSAGIMPEESRLQGGAFILSDAIVSGLIIDDFFSISREPLCDSASIPNSKAVANLRAAKELYLQQGLLGSDDKDVVGDVQFKVCGAEIISDAPSVARGVVVAAAPYEKRLALGLLTSFSVVHGFTSDALHACLVGSWVSVLMMRRQAMAFLNEVFRVIPQEELDVAVPTLRHLPRGAADELCILAALTPILASNLAVPFHTKIFATDASNEMGGICFSEVPLSIAEVAWRSADRVGRNVPLLSHAQAVLAEHDPDFEHPDPWEDDSQDVHPLRPIGMKFDFLEVCGGAGVVTQELVKRGVCCGPVLDVALSPKYNLCQSRVIEWVVFLLENDRLQSFLVAPPCTTFSPAAHPACRTYKKPRGLNPKLPKVHVGNLLAFAALTLMLVALRMKKFGLCETTRRSKMRWLKEWQRLLALGAREVTLASCAYGSVHQKEFGMMGANMHVELLHRKCSRDHVHVRIEGKYTKPSATYCPGLAETLAIFFHDHLKASASARDRLSLRGTGLEDALSNDLAVSLE